MQLCARFNNFITFDHGPLALDGRVVQKILKCQDIKNSFHGLTQICLKPHQIFFQFSFSTNTVNRGVQSLCILEGATLPLIEQWLKLLINLAQTCDEQILKISSWYLDPFQSYGQMSEKLW